MRQKFDPRDDRLQIKEDWALAELGAKVVVILEFPYKFYQNILHSGLRQF